MNRLQEYKGGKEFYVAISHKGSSKCKDVGYIKGIKNLEKAILSYAASYKKLTEVQVMFMRNIMDEDEWFNIPVKMSIEIKL